MIRTKAHRSEVAVNALDDAANYISMAMNKLREAKDEVFDHPAEKDGHHSVDAEIGALIIVQRALSMQRNAWHEYHMFRSTK